MVDEHESQQPGYKKRKIAPQSISLNPPLPVSPAPPPTRGPAPLPVPPTPFVGRQSELSTLAALLADPACRLLTLSGPGGIGKTRLALGRPRARRLGSPMGPLLSRLAGVCARPDRAGDRRCAGL